MSASATVEPEEAGFNAEAYLAKVASGEIPFDPMAGNHSAKVSHYAWALTDRLATHLGMERRMVVTLALAHYARTLMHYPTTTQNDLGVLTQGLQMSLEDLALEVQQFNELALTVHHQEMVQTTPGQEL